jgi:hypothetical protein
MAREDFLGHVRLEMPTLFVRLADESVACQTFVTAQCRGLAASAVLTSPTSLAPVAELGLQVEFHAERAGKAWVVPAQLSTSQMAAQRALVTVTPRLPRRSGNWTVTWKLGGRAIVTQCARAISQSELHRSLRLVDTRFVIESQNGRVRLGRQLPAFHELSRAGPCFLVASGEPGMAGTVPVVVRVHRAGTAESLVIFDQEMLVTDGPVLVAPGTLDVAQLERVTCFEIRVKDETLGVVSTHSIPAAAFTSEGGFRSLADFSWTASADEELNERMSRLLIERSAGK